MIRLIGAVLLAGGASVLGFGAVRGLEKRVSVLDQLLAGLETVRRELEWRLPPLPELMKQASECTRDQVSDFFRLCSVGAMQLNGRTFASVWQMGLESADIPLEDEDRAALERLGSVLGRYDGNCQCQTLDESLEGLKRLRAAARERRDRMGKVYGALGLTAGAFLVILLI